MFYIVEEMQIENCIRFLNKGTTSIRYTPNAELQLILGSNGFGKSSLVDYCMPLAPNKKMFIKGGKHYLKVKFRNSVYELSAEFTGPARYSFVVDGGPNLNDGRTFTIQKKLIEEHFGYTQEIHDLLGCKINFAEMGESQRKEWLLKICPYDLSYAVRIDREANRQMSQLNGTIKKTKEKLVRAQLGVIGDEEVIEIKNSLQTRLQLLSELERFVDNQVSWGHQDESEMADLDHNIRREIVKIELAGTVMDRALASIQLDRSRAVAESVTDAQQSIWEELTQVKSTAAAKYEQQHSLQEIMQAGSQLDEMEESELREKVRILTSTLAQLNVPSEYLEYEDPASIANSLVEVSGLFENFISRLPINPNKSLYGAPILAQINEALFDLHKDLKAYTNQEQLLESRISFIKSQVDVACPECDHKFIPGLRPNELEETQSKLEALRADMLTLRNQIDKAEEDRMKQDEYRDLIREFQAMTRDYPRLTMLWGKCHEDMAMWNNPQSLLGVIAPMVDQFVKADKHWRAIKDLEYYTTSLERKELSKPANYELINAKLADIEKELSDLVEKQQRLEVSHRNVKLIMEKLQQMHDSMDAIEAMVKRHQEKAIVSARAEQARAVNEHINSTKFSMVSLQERLASNDAQLAVVKSLEEMISETVEEIRILGLITEILNPFDGLIAKMMDKFIGEFVGVMNGIAGAIWSHKFIVYKCGSNQNGLDYKFPFAANTNNQPCEDLSHGSSGEMEFINTLFMLTARLYMKLELFPLRLDEVGKFFTEHHRARLYNFVKAAIESKQVGQVFTISHFPSTYSSLTNADVIYLDPTGVSVPENGNQNIIIK